MNDFFRKRILNNIGYKVLAAVFAIILWMVVVNVEDPAKTAVYTLPVRIENPEYLEDLGYSYEILNGTDEISFTVSANRSVMEELTEDDFTVTADLADVSADMTRVPIKVTCSRYNSSVDITKTTAYMTISVEKLGSETFPIEVETTGSPSGQNVVTQTSADPESVTVSGPQSLIDEVATAQVTVDVSDADSDLSQAGDIVLLDASGNEIHDSRLSQNVESATVNVTVLNGKKVPLNLITSGALESEYELDSVTPSVSEVTINGPTEVLEDISKLDIKAPELDLDGKTESYSETIDLEDYLPDGVSLGQGESSKIRVKVKIVSGESSKEYTISKDQITIENLDSSHECSIDVDEITVTLKGTKAELKEIKESDLTATLDVANLDVGTHQVALQLDDAYTPEEEILVPVTITSV